MSKPKKPEDRKNQPGQGRRATLPPTTLIQVSIPTAWLPLIDATGRARSEFIRSAAAKIIEEQTNDNA
jgi:hypothetical protein